MSGCVDAPQENGPGARSPYHACAGQKNLVVTASHNYFGATENTYPGYGVDRTGHAAAVELVSSLATYPPQEQFAIAWVRRGDQHVMVRRYSTATHGFVAAETELSPYPSPAWVRHMGFDEDCLSETGTSQPCAWFVFDDSTNANVRWRAVGANGAMSTIRSQVGRHGSGESATVCTSMWHGICLQYTYKKLLAWITTDRRYVKARLLDGAGNFVGSEMTLATVRQGYEFYQTAVAFSANENRWLVVWTDASPSEYYPPGQAYDTTVDFFTGQPSGVTRVIGPCDGHGQTDGGVTALSAQAGTRENPRNACKGIWLASSWYGPAADRFRFHNYGFHRRITSTGEPAPTWHRSPCKVFCPITEAMFYYGGTLTPFQMLTKATSDSHQTNHLRLGWNSLTDAYLTFDEVSVIDNPWFMPQGFRSNGYVAAALATDKSWGQTGSADLVLSIVDVRYDTTVCPPAP